MSYSLFGMLRVTYLSVLLLVSRFTLSIADKAFFLFPKNSVFQLTLGLSTPITTGKEGTLSFSAGYQFNFVLPYNSTQFETKIVPARNVGFNLQELYTLIENLLNKYGWQHGRQCLLRSICELAETPLDGNAGNFVEEIIRLLLTPTEDLPTEATSTHQSVNEVYQEAERVGRSGVEWNQILGEDKVLYPPPIVYPFGGVLKLLVGIASPISLGGRILVYGQNFQVQYALPTNATFFTEYYSSLRKRRKRSTGHADERISFYQYLERELHRWGGDGKSCMMKSICEASKIPLKTGGLVDEIFNVIFTPDYGNESSHVDKDYLQAAKAGRQGNDCSVIYANCPHGYGLLEKISRIRTVNSD